MQNRSILLGLVILFLSAALSNAYAADLPSRFYGKYTSVNCSECYWILNGDETGVWSIGMNSGPTEKVNIMWEPMIDNTDSLQIAKKGDLTGYVVKVYFISPVSAKVRSVMTSSSRESTHAMVILWHNDRDVELQFTSETNGFYMKD